MWKWVKNWVLSNVKGTILKEIQHLDQYEDELANLIRKYADPDQTSKAVMDWVQKKLTDLVEKVL